MKPGDTIPLALLPVSSVYFDALISSTTITRTANTFATVTGMSFVISTPGNYTFTYNSDVDTGAVNGGTEFAIYQNGTLVAGTVRSMQVTTAILGLITLSTNTIRGTMTIETPKIACALNDVIDVRYRSVNGQTISVYQRIFKWIRVI